MLTQWRFACRVFVWTAFVASVRGVYDVDELKNVHYDLGIAGEPIVFPSELSDESESRSSSHLTGHVTIGNKRGQSYYCRIPSFTPQSEKSNMTSVPVITENITERLDFLKKRSCLKKTVGWWTYEFCYGQYIKQYHLEGGDIAGDVLWLGYFDSEQQWNIDVNLTDAKRKPLTHSQFYTNGTLCDLNSKLRKTEIKFQCEEDSSAYIQRVDEPGTCQYLFTVRTGLLCDIPGFLPPESEKEPLKVDCSPALKKDQYEAYQRSLEVKRKLEEEEAQRRILREAQREVARLEATRKKEALLKMLAGEAGGDDKEGGAKDGPEASSTDDDDQKDDESDLKDKKRLLLREKDLLDKMQGVMEQLLKKKVEELGVDTDNMKTIQFDVEATMDGPDGRPVATITGFDSTATPPPGGAAVPPGSDPGPVPPDQTPVGTAPPAAGATPARPGFTPLAGDDLDPDFVREFNAFQEHAASQQMDVDQIKAELEREFDEIVTEAERELKEEGLLDDDGLDPDSKGALSSIADTLTRLLQRIDATEKNLRDANAKLQSFSSKDKDAESSTEDGASGESAAARFRAKTAHLTSAERDRSTARKRKSGAGDSGEADDESEYAETKVEMPNGQVLVQQHKSKRLESIDAEASAATSKQSDAAATGGRGAGAEAGEEGAVGPATDAPGLDDRVKVRVSKINANQRGVVDDNLRRKINTQSQKLEEQLVDKLKKVGFDPKGRHVQVKIITTSYVDDDNAAELLSDSESAKFSNLIVSILGGDDGQLREKRRMRDLESNYGFELDTTGQPNENSASSAASGESGDGDRRESTDV